MKFYSDFNAMFNAQSGVKSNVGVFNMIEDDEQGYYILAKMPEHISEQQKEEGKKRVWLHKSGANRILCCEINNYIDDGRYDWFSFYVHPLCHLAGGDYLKGVAFRTTSEFLDPPFIPMIIDFAERTVNELMTTSKIPMAYTKDGNSLTVTIIPESPEDFDKETLISKVRILTKEAAKIFDRKYTPIIEKYLSSLYDQISSRDN